MTTAVPRSVDSATVGMVRTVQTPLTRCQLPEGQMDPDETLIIHEDHMNVDDEYDAQDGVDSSDMNGMDENDRADAQHVDHPDGADVAEDADDNAVVSDLTPIGSLSNDPVNNMEEPTLSPKHKRFRDDFSVIGMSDDSESEDEDKPKDDGGMRM